MQNLGVKKISIFILIFCLFVFGIINVYGESNAGNITPGSDSGPGSGDHFDATPVAFGYRISLVNNAGGRITGTKSVDYWQQLCYTRSHGYVNSDYVISHSTYEGGYNYQAKTGLCVVRVSHNYISENIYHLNSKYTKQEVYYGKWAGPTNSVLTSTDNKYDTFSGHGDVDYADKGNSHQGGVVSSGNYITVWAMNKLVGIFNDKNLTDSEYNQVSGLLTNSNYTKGTAGKDRVQKASADGVIIQLEPVSAIHWSGSGTNGIFVGSSTELATINMLGSHFQSYVYKYFTYMNPLIYAKKNSGDSAKKAGITLGTITGNTFNAGAVSIYSTEYPTAVALFRISDYVSVDYCKDKLTDALNSSSKETWDKKRQEIKSKNYSECAGGGCKILDRSYDEIVAYGYKGKTVNSCNIDISCTEKAKAIFDKFWNSSTKTFKSDQTFLGKKYVDYDSARADIIGYSYNKLFSYNILAHGGFPSGNACSSWSCEEASTAVYNKWKNDSTFLNLYLTALNQWFRLFTSKNYPLLLVENWKDTFGLSKPDCKEAPECPPTSSYGSCDSGNGTYSFGDSSSDNCWKQGFAYNVGSSYQSSKSGLKMNNCPIYCRESVVFNLPTKPDLVKAGRVFKWGSNNDLKNEKFGSMTITKECIVKNEGGTCETSMGITNIRNLVTNVTSNTSVTMKYKEPTDSSLDINKKLSIVLQKDESGNTTQPTVLVMGNGYSQVNPTNVSCNNSSCSNLKSFKITGYFDIVYNNNLKWYSYKTDSKLKTHDTIDTSKKAWYYEIGYGLPTSFTTPNGNYKGLSVVVDKVGTKYNSGIGHFDKLLKNKNDNANTSFEYACSFNVKNEFFGDECEYDSSGKLKSGSPEYCDPKEDDDPDGEPKDVDVVFRTVQLINTSAANLSKQLEYAFPGRAGTIDNAARKRGSNWDIADADVADILDSKVYTKSPIYYIELDVPTIQKIRTWNQSAKRSNIDPYSEFRLYSSLNDTTTPGYTGYYCVENNGHKFCASRFLTELKNYYGLKGTCITGSATTSARANKYSKEGCSQ